jgi:hypothetical protein
VRFLTLQGFISHLLGKTGPLWCCTSGHHRDPTCSTQSSLTHCGHLAPRSWGKQPHQPPCYWDMEEVAHCRDSTWRTWQGTTTPDQRKRAPTPAVHSRTSPLLPYAVPLCLLRTFYYFYLKVLSAMVTSACQKGNNQVNGTKSQEGGKF